MFTVEYMEEFKKLRNEVCRRNDNKEKHLTDEQRLHAFYEILAVRSEDSLITHCIEECSALIYELGRMRRWTEIPESLVFLETLANAKLEILVCLIGVYDAEPEELRNMMTIFPSNGKIRPSAQMINDIKLKIRYSTSIPTAISYLSSFINKLSEAFIAKDDSWKETKDEVVQLGAIVYSLLDDNIPAYYEINKEKLRYVEDYLIETNYMGKLTADSEDTKEEEPT